MARMIPAVPYRDTASEGELWVFEKLSSDPEAADWIVLHSLNIARHRKNVSGEADFVVIVPGEGIAVLEVKGCHSLRVDDGVWYFGNDQTGDRRGPFRQASQAMWSLRDWIIERRRDLEGVLFASACVFPFCDLPAQSPEWHEWQVIDRRACQSRPLTRIVRNVLARARQNARAKGFAWADSGAGMPDAACSTGVAHLLRPRFEVFESRASADLRLESELNAFTRQQYRILDALSANPRVLVQGPAGSGKTVLALESVRRALQKTASPQRILLACHNRLLRRWLATQFPEHPGALTISTVSAWMLLLAGITDVPYRAGREFWNVELPRLGIAAARRSQNRFDFVVLDEAQDCMSPACLEFLDSIIVGGLESGRWHAFGDFERQAIFEDGAGSVGFGRDYLSALGVSVRLRSNCRNPPRIAQLVRILGALNPDYDEILRPDDGVEASWEYVDAAANAPLVLRKAIEGFLQEFRERDIVVLSTRTDPESLAARTHVPGHRLIAFESGDAGIRAGTIHAFKGMESRVVILTDVNTLLGDQAQDLFYVGATRAISRLAVVAPTTIRAEFSEILARLNPGDTRA